MKNLLITSGIILFLLSGLNAAEYNDSTSKIIGFNMYHANSASGYGRSLNLNMSIEKERRHMEIGVIMQQESARIYGGEILYRHYLSSAHKNDNSEYDQYRNLRLYFQYNFIFRNTDLPQGIDIMHPTLQENTVPGGRVATFEHYAGAGAQVRIFDNFFLNAGVGYGIILGSVDDRYRDKSHYTMGGRKNEFGLVTKFGLGYFLTR
ncbi:MAG: hypothetical protein R6U58_05335 [Bacteroidales bacterium]